MIFNGELMIRQSSNIGSSITKLYQNNYALHFVE